LTERLAHRDPTAGGQRRAETLRAPAVVAVGSGSCRRHAMLAGEHLIVNILPIYVNTYTCSWRRQRQRMQGRGQGLQRHRCPMLLLIARAGHDAPSVVNRTAAGGGRCKRDAAGMLAGVIPIALRHAICPPTCLQLDKYAATPSLLRLTQHADRRTRLLLRDGRFRSPHFYGGIGPGAVDRAWPLASPCSLFAPRPTGFSVAARSPSAATRERQWLMWNALHSLQLARDSRATLLMLTVRTHAAGRQ
jgi:hypothetical protein